MDTSPFLEAFRRLQTAESRRDALNDLVNELTPYEWRALHAITSTRSFQFDIIGQLPLELIAQIFRHLDPSAPYRLQIISKRWNHALRSPHVLKANLSQWYEGSVDLQHVDYDFLEKKVRKIHAFRNGKPSNVLQVTPTIETSMRGLILAGDSLVWMPRRSREQSRTVSVLDLNTWQLRTLRGEALEVVLRVRASDQIVALATFTGFCYVFELHGTTRKKFRVPSCDYFDIMSCRGCTVACIAAHGCYSLVYIWEYNTQQGRTFQINHGSGHHPHALAAMIQPDIESVIVFTVDSSNDGSFISYKRYTYDGACIGSFQPISAGIGRPLFCMQSFVPAGYKGTFAIHLVKQRDDREGKTLRLLRFDEKLNLLSFWDESLPYGSDSDLALGNSLTRWKDTVYGCMREEGASKRQVLAHLGNSDKRCYTPIVCERQTIPLNMDIETFAANEKYVVWGAVDRLYILCFDGGDNLPKQNGSFFDLGELKILQ